MLSTEDRVKNVLAEQLGSEVSTLKNESKLVEDLGADSLDMVEIVMAIEEEFDLVISDDEARQIITIADAITYVESRKKKVRIG